MVHQIVLSWPESVPCCRAGPAEELCVAGWHSPDAVSQAMQNTVILNVEKHQQHSENHLRRACVTGEAPFAHPPIYPRQPPGQTSVAHLPPEYFTASHKDDSRGMVPRDNCFGVLQGVQPWQKSSCSALADSSAPLYDR